MNPLIPTGETFPITAEQALAAHQEATAAFQATEAPKLAAMQAAASIPLPGPAADAFAAEPPNIFGIQLVPITASHIVLLQRLDNPFLKSIRLLFQHGAEKGKKEKKRILAKLAKLNISPEDTFEVLYLFAHPAPHTREMLATSKSPSDLPPGKSPSVALAKEGQALGRALLRTAALDLADRLPPLPNLIETIQAVLTAHYIQSFCTAIGFQPATTGGPPESFPSPAAPTSTASAGS